MRQYVFARLKPSCDMSRHAARSLQASAFAIAIFTSAAALVAQAPAQRPTAGTQQPPGAPQPQARGGAPQRRAIQLMTLTSAAFKDGGEMPAKYTQAGDEVSPPLTWSNVPDGTTHFVLIVHDVDAPIPPGTDDTLQWMVWNIPAATTSLPEHVPQGSQLSDGSRQISATGPFYRGPGAAAAGPAHHYVFELFALDAPVDVPAVGASPPQTRTAVLAAMAGHVRGKGAAVALFRRAS